MNDYELRLLELHERRDPHLSTIIANSRPVVCPHGPLAIAICAAAIQAAR